MFQSIFYVATGSAIGGVCRYLMQQTIQQRVTGLFPWGTLAVNVLGCFVIGLIYGLAARTNVLSPQGRIFLAVGICGGFTTYSSFMMENYTLAQSGQLAGMLLYTGLSLIVGYGATALGVACVR
jgi:fluoride exporter